MCEYTDKTFFPTEGELPVCMTNDLLFHLLLQEPDASDILKGLISSFQDIEFDEINSVIVQNPISFGETINSKTMVLDVKAILNNNSIVNLEMQVINCGDWPERSLSYLCRCFDNIESGQGYDSVKGAFHIGFLNYTLFPDAPVFFASYEIKNAVTNRLYTSKFGISVVDLTLIDMATDEDKKLHRHLWASFFRAATWEEINMIATQDKNIQLAATKLYQLSEDQRIRDELWARQDAIRQQIDFENYHRRRYEEVEAKRIEAEAKYIDAEAKYIDAEAKCIEAEAAVAERDSVIESLKAEIEQLKAGK